MLMAAPELWDRFSEAGGLRWGFHEKYQTTRSAGIAALRWRASRRGLSSSRADARAIDALKSSLGPPKMELAE